MGSIRKDGIPYRNHSPDGWWVASYMMRVVWDNEVNASLNKRCLAWENTIIIEAKDREAAYENAIKLGKEGCGGSIFDPKLGCVISYANRILTTARCIAARKFLAVLS